MSAPFIYITTHRFEPARRAELDALTVEYTDFMRANEGDLLAHYSYLDGSGTELSLVQVHRDAGSAERHMRLAGPLIHRGVALATTIRVQVYGELGPMVRRYRPMWTPERSSSSRRCPAQDSPGKKSMADHNGRAGC